MGESRVPHDTVSASSEDSIRPPPRVDPARIKLGPNFLPADAQDPLKHDEVDLFWSEVDAHFHPINQDHIRFLRTLPVNPYNGERDIELRTAHPSTIVAAAAAVATPAEKRKEARRETRRDRANGSATDQQPHQSQRATAADRAAANSAKLKAENSLAVVKHPASSITTTDAASTSAVTLSSDADTSNLLASLNSFPFTHRLVAALLDEKPSVTSTLTHPPNRPNRPLIEEALWSGPGTEPELRKHQFAVEARIKHELHECGLLDEKQDEPIQNTLRQDQWRLRDLKTLNRIRKSTLYTTVYGSELRQQAYRREMKLYQDKVEMAYLKRMIRNMKKNKKSRAKLQKIYQRMFGHYKEQKDKVAEKSRKNGESLNHGRLLTNGDDKARSSGKKKKKKSEAAGSSSAATANTNGKRHNSG